MEHRLQCLDDLDGQGDVALGVHVPLEDRHDRVELPTSKRHYGFLAVTLEDRIRVLEGPELGHSASAIRRLTGQGRSIHYLVPPAVEAYIHDHDLYPAELWSKN